MDRIKFDETAVTTDLAEEYLKNNKILKSKGFNDSEESISNDYKNVIYFSNYTRTSGSVILCNDINEIPKKLYNLAKKIEENVDLFCQLELLIRKIPSNDTKNIDLKLITQNLFHYSSSKPPQINKTTARQIVVLGDAPLLVLGCVAQSLIARMPQVVIECTKETAPVCSLFTDLCYEVGLKEKVLLAILPQSLDDSLFKVTVDFGQITDFMMGGVGIVSGKSDVDSAVDTFLAASSRNSPDQFQTKGSKANSDIINYPWALKKIFVQECVLERFRRALAWKAEKRAPGSGGDGVESSWSSSYRCGDKVFAMEAAGPGASRVVSVEAYRTVRELLALLDAPRPLAASLWSADVAESLELAHGLGATLVWVNDFADFRGPPRVSQAFYSVVDSYFNTRMLEYMPEFEEITKLRQPWLRFSVDERKDFVRNALTKIDNKEARKIIEDIETFTFEMDSFVYVTDNVVATGVEILPEVMLPCSFYDNHLDLSIVCYIIRGGALLLHIPERLMAVCKTKRAFYMFYENLRSSGAPVIFTKKEYNFGNIPIIRNPINKTKVIWTNYGTVFAN